MHEPVLPGPTARLACRPWTAADLPLAQQLWGDPRVTQYVAGPWTDEQVAARLERYLGLQREHGFTYWPWFLTVGPPTTESVAAAARRRVQTEQYGGQWPPPLDHAMDFVGTCGLKPPPPEECQEGGRVLETGFYLRPEFHGLGYAAEMARAVLAHAFGPLGCTALWAGCHPDNAASRRLLERLGFREHGTEFYAPIGMEQPTFLLTGGAWKAGSAC